MVELFSKDDYKGKVSDPLICKYLENSFKRYPDDFEFGKESSFILLDDISELDSPITLSNGQTIPSIKDSMFEDMITIIDGDEDVIDMVLLFSDYGDGVSIIIRESDYFKSILA